MPGCYLRRNPYQLVVRRLATFSSHPGSYYADVLGDVIGRELSISSWESRIQIQAVSARPVDLRISFAHLTSRDL